MGENVSSTDSRADAYKGCVKAGKPGSDKYKTCTKMIDVCLSESSDSYTLVTDAGSYTFDDQKKCMTASILYADTNFKLVGSKVKPKKDAQQTKKDKSATKKKQVLADFMSICTAKPKGPYTLPISAGALTAKDQASCIKMAGNLTRMGFKRASAKKTQPKIRKNPESPIVPSEPNDEATAPKRMPNLTKSFSDIRLALRVTGDKYVRVKRTLLFDGGKGFPIWLRYSVKRKGDGNFLMRYTIYKGGKALGREQSLTFKAASGKIDLAFEVFLKSKGNIESMRVVDMSDQ